MNIKKNGSDSPCNKDKFTTKETFRSDKQLSEKLATIPKKEKSTIIRMALRDYFGLTDSKRGIVGYKDGEKKDETP